MKTKLVSILSLSLVLALASVTVLAYKPGCPEEVKSILKSVGGCGVVADQKDEYPNAWEKCCAVDRDTLLGLLDEALTGDSPGGGEITDEEADKLLGMLDAWLAVGSPEELGEVGGKEGKPTAEFSYVPDSPKVGKEITFTSESSDPDNDIDTWNWDLDGDGSYDDGEGEKVTHTFESVDDHEVGLKVSDTKGNTDLKRKTVTVVEVEGPGAGWGESCGDGTPCKEGLTCCDECNECYYSCPTFSCCDSDDDCAVRYGTTVYECNQNTHECEAKTCSNGEGKCRATCLSDETAVEGCGDYVKCCVPGEEEEKKFQWTECIDKVPSEDFSRKWSCNDVCENRGKICVEKCSYDDPQGNVKTSASGQIIWDTQTITSDSKCKILSGPPVGSMSVHATSCGDEYTYEGPENSGSSRLCCCVEPGKITAPVTLYEDENFAGGAKILKDESSFCDYGTVGPFDDKTSSVKVKDGYFAELHAGKDCTGDFVTVTGDSSSLHFGDKVSSIKIETTSMCDRIEIHEDTNYEGSSRYIYKDRADLSTLSCDGCGWFDDDWNNDISSIGMVGGTVEVCTVTLYEHKNFNEDKEGKKLTIYGSTNSLHMGNKVSSVRIEEIPSS